MKAMSMSLSLALAALTFISCMSAGVAHSDVPFYKWMLDQDQHTQVVAKVITDIVAGRKPDELGAGLAEGWAVPFEDPTGSQELGWDFPLFGSTERRIWINAYPGRIRLGVGFRYSREFDAALRKNPNKLPDFALAPHKEMALFFDYHLSGLYQWSLHTLMLKLAAANREVENDEENEDGWSVDSDRAMIFVHLEWIPTITWDQLASVLTAFTVINQMTPGCDGKLIQEAKKYYN